MTFTLLLNSRGEKMGKTMGGAVWLSPEKTPTYDFYQYWRNIDDADVKKSLSLMTFLPMEQVEELSALKDSAINEAKETLAFEVTKIVHGEEEAEKAKAAARSLFAGNADSEFINTKEISGDMPLVELLVDHLSIVGSRREARENIKNGAISVGGEKVTDVEFVVTKGLFANNKLLIQKGKKIHVNLVWSV
jgi:tyrosyl-tRNA synthetase